VSAGDRRFSGLWRLLTKFQGNGAARRRLTRRPNDFESAVSDTEYVLEKVVVATTHSHAFKQDEPPVQMSQLLPNLLLLLRTTTE
jgi:hypothetical protein